MTRTRLLTTAVALAATVVVGWAPAVPAEARGASAASTGALAQVPAAAYRYWTYWVGDSGTWTFATAGPASLVPADGSVQGWRFAVTTDAGAATSQPRSAASFADICGATAPQEGRKRVALVVDPGDAAQAPSGQQPGPAVATCVVAEPDATGYQVLRSASTVRVESGLVCGIDGYPTGECAPVVDEPASPGAPATSPSSAATSPAATPPAPTSSAVDTGAMNVSDDADGSATGGSPWAVAAVLLVVAAVAGLFVWRRARD